MRAWEGWGEEAIGFWLNTENDILLLYKQTNPYTNFVYKPIGINIFHQSSVHHYRMTFRVCTSKYYLNGQTFGQWISDTASNIYIGPEGNKYSRGRIEDSKWSPTPIFMKHKNVSIHTKLYFYEKFVREHLLSEIMELVGMRLGCFCTPTQICHGDVLLRIISEEMAAAEEDFNNAPVDEVTTTTTPISAPAPIAVSPKPKKTAKRKLFDDDGNDSDYLLSPATKDAKSRRNFSGDYSVDVEESLNFYINSV